MVKYNYRCLVCGIEFEVEKHYTDKKQEKCPECKSKQVRKIIGVPSITFVGDGFTLSNSE